MPQIDKEVPQKGFSLKHFLSQQIYWIEISDIIVRGPNTPTYLVIEAYTHKAKYIKINFHLMIHITFHRFFFLDKSRKSSTSESTLLSEIACVAILKIFYFFA